MKADVVPQASDDIRNIAQIYRNREFHSPETQRIFRWPFSKKLPAHTIQLGQAPELGWLLMFSGNGFVRQAGIEALTGPPQCPFEFSAIVYRLNDWVENVRKATVAYCKEHLEKTSTDIITESAFFLIHQSRLLKRWDNESEKLLKDVIYRPEVVHKLKDRLLSAKTGHVGPVFQALLQRQDFDRHLLELSGEAALPTIRATAAKTLLSRRAQWFVGYEQEWVDKSLGLSRRIARFDNRSIEIDVQFDEVLERASADKSAQVRKIAADALIANRFDADEKMDKIADTLAEDRNSSVRSRADFYKRKRNS